MPTLWSCVSRMVQAFIWIGKSAESGIIRTSDDHTAMDMLAYNDPFAYVRLMLHGDPHKRLKEVVKS